MSIDYYLLNLEPQRLIKILYDDLESIDVVKETEAIERLRFKLGPPGPSDKYYSPFGTTFKDRFLIIRQWQRKPYSNRL